jgi:hypothetical protein
MLISLNSPDSKISPHSRHSTNSSSSSRATICTRGCLHALGFLLPLGTGEGGMGVINPGINSCPNGRSGAFSGNCGYCSLAFGLVKLFLASEEPPRTYKRGCDLRRVCRFSIHFFALNRPPPPPTPNPLPKTGETLTAGVFLAARATPVQ